MCGDDVFEACSDIEEGFFPGAWDQLAIAPDQWSTEPLRTVDELKTPTSAITEPAVIDIIVCARHQAHDLIHAHIDAHIAANATVVAHTWYALQLPRACSETIACGSQCAN